MKIPPDTRIAMRRKDALRGECAWGKWKDYSLPDGVRISVLPDSFVDLHSLLEQSNPHRFKTRFIKEY